MLYQLSYASPQSALPRLPVAGDSKNRPENLPTTRKTFPASQEHADTLTLRAYHGTEIKVSIADHAEQTGVKPGSHQPCKR